MRLLNVGRSKKSTMALLDFHSDARSVTRDHRWADNPCPPTARNVVSEQTRSSINYHQHLGTQGIGGGNTLSEKLDDIRVQSVRLAHWLQRLATGHLRSLGQ